MFRFSTLATSCDIRSSRIYYPAQESSFGQNYENSLFRIHWGIKVWFLGPWKDQTFVERQIHRRKAEWWRIWFCGFQTGNLDILIFCFWKSKVFITYIMCRFSCKKSLSPCSTSYLKLFHRFLKRSDLKEQEFSWQKLSQSSPDFFMKINILILMFCPIATQRKNMTAVRIKKFLFKRRMNFEWECLQKCYWKSFN